MSEGWSKYTLTAARSHSPSSRPRPTSGTIDIHSHIIVPAADELVAPYLAKVNDGTSADTIAVGRKQLAERRPHMLDLAIRLPDLDAMGLERQVIKPSPQQCYYDVPPDVAVKSARLVNDGVAEFAARRPDRFIPFGSVPMSEPTAAVSELDYCARKLGFKGIQILTNVAGRELSDPAFEPFWAKAEELKVLVVIHPAGFTEPRRLSRFYFGNVIGNPLDTTVAVHHLIFDGVLERYPELRILAVHGGAYAAAYSGRMDHAWGARSDSLGTLPKPPSHYLRKLYVDTVVFTPHQLDYLVQIFGADRVLMGTDYPFDMGEYDPVGHVLAVDRFDEPTITAIVGGNARRLLAPS
jgi:aminocarboxymuconate-semialdehyde decarboxylase